MREEVSKALKEIYFPANPQLYLERCKNELDIDLHDVKQLLAGLEIQVEYWNEDLYPSGIFSIEFSRASKNIFSCSFQSKFMFSKLIKVFYVEHLFEVENIAQDRVAPNLDGFSNQAYILPQFNAHEKIKNIALEKGYVELNFADISEIICDLSFPNDVVLFGRQVSVEYALFHDFVFDLCD